MKKILVIGSFMTDLVFKTSKMPSTGETLIAEQYEKYTGGKGANQAVAASRLGGNVEMIGKLGNYEFGKEHIEKLEDENIKHQSIMFDNNARTGVGNVTIDKDGNNKILVVPGANLKLVEEEILNHENIIKNSDIIVLQLEIPINVVYKCIDLAYKHGKVIILNPAPAQDIDKEIAHKVDYIIPNETEAEVLTNYEVATIEDAKSAAQILLDQGYKHTIITLGNKGAIYATRDKWKYFNGINVDAVDTTAAGDSFIGTLAYGLAQDFNIEEIMLMAIKASACTVKKLGAQPSLPKWRDIKKLDEIVEY